MVREFCWACYAKLGDSKAGNGAGSQPEHGTPPVLPRYKAYLWLQVFLPQKAASRRRFDLKKPALGKMSWWIMDPR